MAAAVVLQQMTLRYQPVTPRHHSTPEKKIRVPIAVEITNSHTGAVLEDVGKRATRAREVSVAVVHVKARAQSVLPTPEFVPAAHDKQVGMPISIRVEEARADVFRQTVSSKCWLITRAEGSVALLDEKLSGLPLCAADVKIVKPIAVDVRHSQPRSFGRQQVRHQRLAIVVVERVFLVLEIDTARRGDIREHRRRSRPSRRGWCWRNRILVPV